jgi:hypothetical protein
MYDPSVELTSENIKNALDSHQSLIGNVYQSVNRLDYLRLQGQQKSIGELKVYSDRLQFSITQTFNRIQFPVPFISIPTVQLTVEQADPFFVTPVIKSVTQNEVNYAIFYSGNINVQNYTLHVTAIGY